MSFKQRCYTFVVKATCQFDGNMCMLATFRITAKDKWLPFLDHVIVYMLDCWCLTFS